MRKIALFMIATGTCLGSLHAENSIRLNAAMPVTSTHSDLESRLRLEEMRYGTYTKSWHNDFNLAHFRFGLELRLDAGPGEVFAEYRTEGKATSFTAERMTVNGGAGFGQLGVTPYRQSWSDFEIGYRLPVHERVGMSVLGGRRSWSRDVTLLGFDRPGSSMLTFAGGFLSDSFETTVAGNYLGAEVDFKLDKNVDIFTGYAASISPLSGEASRSQLHAFSAGGSSTSSFLIADYGAKADLSRIWIGARMRPHKMVSLEVGYQQDILRMRYDSYLPIDLLSMSLPSTAELLQNQLIHGKTANEENAGFFIGVSLIGVFAD